MLLLVRGSGNCKYLSASRRSIINTAYARLPPATKRETKVFWSSIRDRDLSRQAHPNGSLNNRLKIDASAATKQVVIWIKNRRQHGFWPNVTVSTMAAIFASTVLFVSLNVVPVGTVGVKPGTRSEKAAHWEVLKPGWYIMLPWNPMQPWSTRRQHATFRTRVTDGQGHKVFVTVLIEYQISDPQAFLCRNGKNMPQSTNINTNNQFFRFLVVQHAKTNVAKLFGLDKTVNLLYTRKQTTHDLGVALTEQLSKPNCDPVLQGVRIHHTTITEVKYSYKLEQALQKIHNEVGSRKFEIQKWNQHVNEIRAKSDEELKQIAESVMGSSNDKGT